MKRLFTILLLVPFIWVNGQVEEPPTYERQVLSAEDGSDSVVFVLRDTVGDVGLGQYNVKVFTLDSAAFLTSIYNNTKDFYAGVGNAETSILFGNRNAANYRGLAEDITGNDDYFAWSHVNIRPYFEGTWVYRVNGTDKELTVDEFGRGFEDGTLTIRIACFSDNRIIITDVVNNNDRTTVAEYGDDRFIGDGPLGRVFFIRKN